MASSAHDVRSFAGQRLDARTVVRLNAIASVAVGSLMLLIAGPMARQTGIARPGILAITGALLWFYGLDGLGLAVGRRLRRAHVRLFAFADAAWVGGGVALLVAGPHALTFLERALVAVAAILFVGFSFAGWRAARGL
jgi:hypothetical protein